MKTILMLLLACGTAGAQEMKSPDCTQYPQAIRDACEVLFRPQEYPIVTSEQHGWIRFDDLKVVCTFDANAKRATVKCYPQTEQPQQTAMIEDGGSQSWTCPPHPIEDCIVTACTKAGQKDCVDVMCVGRNLVKGCPGYKEAKS